LYVSLKRQKIDNAYHIDKIDTAENYSENGVAFEHQKINDMYNNGIILEINRVR